MSRRDIAVGLFALAAFATPIFWGNAYVLTVGTQCLLMIVLCLAWNLAAGYCGTKSLGHQAFFGIGAYGAAIAAVDYGVPPWMALLLGSIIAACAAALLGAIILRLSTFAFAAIGTLAFAEIIRISASNFKDLTRGELGFWGIPPLPGPGSFLTLQPNDFVGYYLVAGAIALLAYVSYFAMVKSRIGLAVRAIRDAPAAAEASGINLARYKLAVFVWGGAVVGLAGGFYAFQIRVLAPASVLGLDLIVTTIAMTILGGIGTLNGPIIGAIVLTVAGELLRPLGDWRMIVNGLLIMVIVLFWPAGILGGRR